MQKITACFINLPAKLAVILLANIRTEKSKKKKQILMFQKLRNMGPNTSTHLGKSSVHLATPNQRESSLTSRKTTGHSKNFRLTKKCYSQLQFSGQPPQKSRLLTKPEKPSQQTKEELKKKRLDKFRATVDFSIKKDYK